MPPPSEFLIFRMYGCKGRTCKKKNQNSKDIEVRVA